MTRITSVVVSMVASNPIDLIKTRPRALLIAISEIRARRHFNRSRFNLPSHEQSHLELPADLSRGFGPIRMAAGQNFSTTLAREGEEEEGCRSCWYTGYAP
jgi:hypothetical protein